MWQNVDIIPLHRAALCCRGWSQCTWRCCESWCGGWPPPPWWCTHCRHQQTQSTWSTRVGHYDDENETGFHLDYNKHAAKSQLHGTLLPLFTFTRNSSTSSWNIVKCLSFDQHSFAEYKHKHCLQHAPCSLEWAQGGRATAWQSGKFWREPEIFCKIQFCQAQGHLLTSVESCKVYEPY